MISTQLPKLPAALCLAILSSCGSLHRSYEYEDVTTKRVADQSYYEDSAHVFFAEYPNPYPDRDVLWVSSFLHGSVEVFVHDTRNDSLRAVIHFEPQERPLYVVAYRSDPSTLVKCVAVVNGRAKCARLYPSLYPLPQPQWGTTYTVEWR